LLALLTVLAAHGWTVRDGLHAGAAKVSIQCCARLTSRPMSIIYSSLTQPRASHNLQRFLRSLFPVSRVDCHLTQNPDTCGGFGSLLDLRAVLIPVPDRISLISPPSKSTPALISAVRNAIISTSTSTSRGSSHLHSGMVYNPGTTATAVNGRGNASGQHAANTGMGDVTWNEKQGQIKLEGWVHDGVYRFWVKGMRRWLGGGVKRSAVER
jgi:hypothetical protein